MATTFSDRTVNENYRQARMDGGDDAAARVRVKARLLEVYGSEPSEAQLDAAAAMYDHWRAGERERIASEREALSRQLERLDVRNRQLES